MAQAPEDSQSQGGHCYAAVIENRAKEVGIAVLDLSRLTLQVTQVSRHTGPLAPAAACPADCQLMPQTTAQQSQLQLASVAAHVLLCLAAVHRARPLVHDHTALAGRLSA